MTFFARVFSVMVDRVKLMSSEEEFFSIEICVRLNRRFGSDYLAPLALITAEKTERQVQLIALITINNNI